MEYKKKVEGVLFSRLMQLNHPDFDITACDYREKVMFAKDKAGACKDGSSRVALFLATGHPLCFTLECHYMKGKLVNKGPPFDV